MADLGNLFAAESDGHSMQTQLIPNSSVIVESPQIQQKLPPEPQTGNVEYKLMLDTTNGSRLQHLTTQLNWRLKEGNGQAIYEIGVADDGTLVGLSRTQMHKSLVTLSQMAAELEASVFCIRERIISTSSAGQPQLACQILVLKNQIQQKDLRFVVLGNTFSGKSTLIGVLTSGKLDDGKGHARMNLFCHRHEIQSGKTSSISRQILGFDENGNALNYSGNSTFPQQDDDWRTLMSRKEELETGRLFQANSPEEICQHASKLITFIDLGGHPKYFKTTISGLCGNFPHIGLLVLNALADFGNGTTMEHLSLLSLLQLPFWIVINKIDMISSEQLDQLKKQIRIKLSQRNIVDIQTMDQAKEFANKQNSNSKLPSIALISVSCTTGKHLQLLYSLLFGQFQLTVDREVPTVKSGWTKFYVEKVFHDHSVVGGVLVSGQITVGERVLIGPDSKGVFHPTRITSLQKFKTLKPSLCDESGTVGLEWNKEQTILRKGMVLVSAREGEGWIQKHVCIFFKARFKSVNEEFNWNRNGLQATFYSNYIRQNVEIVKTVSKKSKRSTLVLLRFVKQPEFINTGDVFLLKEGPNKTAGKVVQLFSLQTNLH